MGVVKKQSVYATFYSYIGVVLGFVSMALLFPRFLSTDENGVLRLLGSYSVLFAQFASLGFNNVTIKFFPFFRHQGKGNRGFFALSLTIGLLGFLLFLPLFFLTKSSILEDSMTQSSLFKDYVLYVIPLTFFTLFFNALDAYLRSLHQSIFGTVLKEVVQRLFIFTSILCYIFDIVDFGGLVLLYTSALILPAILLFFFLWYKKELSLRLDRSLLDFDMKKNMFKVSIFGFVTGFSLVAVLSLDSIMIDWLIGTSSTGIYAITYYFGALVAIPSRAMKRIGGAVIADHFKKGNEQVVLDLYQKSCLNQVILGTLLLLGIWCNIDNVFEILPKTFLPGKYVILFIGLTNWTVMMGGLSSMVIANSEHYRYNAYFSFLLVILVVISNYVLIPPFGITGAAMASLIAMIVFELMKVGLIYLKYRFQPYDGRIAIIIAIAIVTWWITSCLPNLGSLYLDLPLRSLLVLLLFGLPVFLLRLSEDINELIIKVTRSIGLY